MNLMISTDFELVRHTHKYLAPSFSISIRGEIIRSTGGTAEMVLQTNKMMSSMQMHELSS